MAIAPKRGQIQIDEMAVARGICAEQSPYMKGLLWTFLYVELPDGGGGVLPYDTMGVTAAGVVYYTRAAISKWSDEERATVLEHECWHVFFEHPFQEFGADHPEVRNIAMDLSVNSILLEEERKLPKTVMVPETFGYPRGLSWVEYYDRLMKDAKPMPMDGVFGWCGSGGGRKLPGEPDVEAQRADGARSESEMMDARRQVAREIQAGLERGDKAIGELPGAVLREVKRLLRPPRIPWQDRLRRALRHGLAVTSGMVDYTYQRRHRRQGAMIMACAPAQAPVLPAMCANDPRVLVSIDTSGSMSAEDLALGMSEIAGVFKVVRSVHYCSWDAGCTSIREPARNWQAIAKDLHGGGGTCIGPFFDELTKMRAQPSVVVIVTDGGFCDCPPKPPSPRMHFIWLVVGRWRCTDSIKFGEVIEVIPDGPEPADTV